MKLLMAASIDGYTATGPNDDMSWTSEGDKKVFRLLSNVDGPLLAGSRTWRHMPVLPGRALLPITRNPRIVTHIDATAAIGEPIETLASRYPFAWHIGGMQSALDAMSKGFIHEIHLCRSLGVRLDIEDNFHSKYHISRFWKFFNMKPVRIMRFGPTLEVNVHWPIRGG